MKSHSLERKFFRVPSADVGHVVEALYVKLSSEAEGARAAEERQEALEALLRCKEEMGEQGGRRQRNGSGSVAAHVQGCPSALRLLLTEIWVFRHCARPSCSPHSARFPPARAESGRRSNILVTSTQNLRANG